MPNLLVRSTKAFIPNVPKEELEKYPEDDCILDPDLSAVEGVPHIHWVLESDDTLRAMTKEEIAALPTTHEVEAAEKAAKEALAKG